MANIIVILQDIGILLLTFGVYGWCFAVLSFTHSNAWKGLPETVGIASFSMILLVPQTEAGCQLSFQPANSYVASLGLMLRETAGLR